MTRGDGAPAATFLEGSKTIRERHHVTRVAWRMGGTEPSLPAPSYLDAVVGLLVDDGDVLPAELEDDLGHGEGLVVVAGDGAREVLEALLVRQLGARREERDLKRVSVSGGLNSDISMGKTKIFRPLIE